MRTRKSLSAAVCLAIAASFGAAAPAAAQAPGAVPVQAGAQVTAVTTADLNVRSGPGTSYGVLFVAPRGATVTIQGCNPPITWCSILYGGRAGWASASFLRSTQNQQPIPNAGAQLGIAIFNFVAGAIARELGIQPPAQPQPPPAGPRLPAANEVCFYDGGNFDGEATCVTMGQSNTNLAANWNDRISSIRVGANAQVQVCGDYNYGGWCETYYDDVSLRGFRNNAISSYRTTGFGQGPSPQPPPGPAPDATVCFFDGGGYGGAGFCLRRGGALQSLQAEWDNRITSIRIDPGLTVQVCRDAFYAGWCEEYTSSVPYLPSGRDNAISSVRVF
ncbi:MAG: peptidase inhibitor family I36 protein [Bauldia sp.]|nr:peptidase inhibitor family I36 protein [Bauldia sp.]